MQSILQEYYKGNHIGNALLSFNQTHPEHELGYISLLTYQTIIDPSLFDKNIKKINSIPYAEYSCEEQLFFLELLFWLYSSILNRQNNAQTILSLIHSLSKNDVPIEFKVMPIIMQGQLHSNNGDIQHLTIAHEKALGTLRGKSERYHKILWDHLIHLYNTNQFEKTEDYLEELKLLLKNHPMHRRINYILLLDAISKADWHKAKSEIEQVQLDNNLSRFYHLTLSQFSSLCDLFLHTHDFQPDLKDKKQFHLISYWYLMQKNKTKAMQFARIYADTTLKPLGFSDFHSYCLIRSELANNNIHTAEFILNKKAKAGANNLLDYFFWFRIYHIKKDNKKAIETFCFIYNQFSSLNLLKRLDTEIELSPELTIYDFKYYLDAYNNTLETNKLAINNNLIDSKSQSEIDEISGFIIGDSKSMLVLKSAIIKISDSDLPILIRGETGTGKELAAKAIHQSSSKKNKKFFAINCGAISDHLLLSELFGHKQGAFTGAYSEHKGILEAANDGTVFLDEIGEISTKMQISLLRVLETLEFCPLGDTKSKKINCKLIFATNRNLGDMVKKGEFRQDLQFRLERLMIEVPPLRERIEDLPLLTNYFLNSINPNLPTITIDNQLMKHLQNQKWHGNIRELKNEMERMRLFHSDKSVLYIEDLSDIYRVNTVTESHLSNIKQIPQPISNTILPLNLKSKFRKLDELKQFFIQYNKLSRSETSKLLKISLNTAAQYLYDLEVEGFIEKITPTNSAKSHYYQIKKS